MMSRTRCPLFLVVLMLLGACGHTASTSSQATTPACSTSSTVAPTPAEAPLVASSCASLGTRTSHEGVDVSVVGVQVALAVPSEAEEEDEGVLGPFTSLESGSTFALRAHARDAIVGVGDLRVTSLVSDSGERIEDLAAFPAPPWEISDSGRDAIVYGRIGGVAAAPTACLRLEGTLPVRLGSGTARATARVSLREGATFDLAGIRFEVTGVDFVPGEVLPLQVELRTRGDFNRIRALSFTQQGVVVPSDRTELSSSSFEEGVTETTVRYTFERRASTIDVEATLFGEVRDVEVPIHFGIGVGLAER